MTVTRASYLNNHNKTPILSREELHRTFGGRIYASDFDTEYAGRYSNESSMAGRIMSDWRFDRQCKVDRENGQASNERMNKDTYAYFLRKEGLN